MKYEYYSGPYHLNHCVYTNNKNLLKVLPRTFKCLDIDENCPWIMINTSVKFYYYSDKYTSIATPISSWAAIKLIIKDV